MRSRRLIVLLAGCWSLATAGCLVQSGAAFGEYGGHDGEQAFEVSSSESDTGSQTNLAVAVQTRERTLVECTNAPEPASRTTCGYGVPSYSPDGGSVVFSYQAGGPGRPSQLAVVGAGGGTPRVLPRLTASDTEPAFLPGGRSLVFAGITSARSRFNLYTVPLSGKGLRRLTSAGGSAPASCDLDAGKTRRD